MAEVLHNIDLLWRLKGDTGKESGRGLLDDGAAQVKAVKELVFKVKVRCDQLSE